MKNNSLQQLKEEYTSIPIPETLPLRVEAALAQAKRERKQKERRKLMTKTVKTIGATAAALMLTVTVLANSTQNIALAMEQVPVLGAITRVVTFRSFTEQKGDLSARVEVPQAEGAEEVNDAIRQYTDTVLEQYRQDAAEAGEDGHYALDLDYAVVTDSDRIFALRMNQTIVMADGAESVKIYNVDKTTGRILTLADLFAADSDYLGRLTENIQEQMRRQMAENEELSYWVDQENDEWNFSLSDDTAFYIDADGQLTLVFDEGEAGPMSMGIVEFTIPSSAIADIAQPAYLR